MKILVVTESYWPNTDGGAVFEHRLSQQLVNADYEVFVITPTIGSDKTVQEQTEDGITVFRVPSRVLLNNKKYRVSKQFGTKKIAQQVLNKVKPDIIHIHNFGVLGRIFIRLAKKDDITVVTTNHFMPENALLNTPIPKLFHSLLSPLLWKYLVSYCGKADAVVSPTKTAVDLLQKHGLNKSAQAITNGINTDQHTYTSPTKAVLNKYYINQPSYFLYFGRVDGEKRLDLLIKAYSRLPKNRPQLVICGDGGAKQGLQALASSLGLSNDIVFTGKVDEIDKVQLYSGALSFVITSPAELQSIVCLEAMSCSVPVIAFDRVALKELCIDGRTGWLVPWPNVDNFAQAMKDCYEGSARESFGQNARTLILGNHTEAKSLDMYTKLYKSIVE